MTEDIKIADVAANTNVAFKICAPFTRCVTHITDEHFETAESLDIIMPMYNLIEYSDNYEDSSRTSYQFKRDKSPMINHQSFKCCFRQFKIFQRQSNVFRKSR